MAMRAQIRGRVLWVVFWLCAGNALCCLAPAQRSPEHAQPVKDRMLAGRFPEKPSIAPTWTLPVETLGFAAPGPIYLGQRNSMVSLDFLDENQLLFTFHVPGLQRREAGNASAGEARQIRAVVLALPTGTVQAQAQWTVHSSERYLWMLKDGHFLLSNGSNLLQGDASLSLKPLLKFPGRLLTVDSDPSQQFLVTNSSEPESGAKPGEVPSPSTASATVDSGQEDPSGQSGIVVRILRRDTGEVLLVSRVRAKVYLPINSDGYIETLRGNAQRWVLDLSYFTGGSRILGNVDSSCMPGTTFVSEQEVLATTCSDTGGNGMLAMTTDGRTLWKESFPEQTVWPLVTIAPNGLRIARESLFVKQNVNAFSPLGTDDIKGQWLRVFDAASGEVVLEAPANPILDAGGNVAISPSGRRVALLSSGGIEVFELPAAPSLPPAPIADTKQ
jgi:hypothetical protein